MNRRDFLMRSGAFALAAAVPLPLSAQPRRFASSRLTVQVRGRGRDVIMIPGMTSGRNVWDQAVRANPGYRYHLVQVAGFAGDPARGNAHGRLLAPLTEEIARYIAAAGLNRPAIVGHSMGGTIGMMLAARYPARVGRLMVVDMLPRPSGLYGGTAGSNLAGWLDGLIDNNAARRALSGLVSAFSPPDLGSDPDVVARAMHDLGRTDLTSELGRIRAPMTVLYGVPEPRARAATEAAFRAGYRGVRSVRLVPMEGAGHFLMADQPRRFAALLGEFLR